MKSLHAMVVYAIGMIFAIGGYFNKSILIAGWVMLSGAAVIGLVFEIE